MKACILTLEARSLFSTEAVGSGLLALLRPIHDLSQCVNVSDSLFLQDAIVHKPLEQRIPPNLFVKV